MYEHLTSKIEQLRYQRHAVEVCNFAPRNGKVLDLGCGFGTLMLMIRKLRPDVRIIGVDLDDHGVFWDKYAEIGILFVKGDALHTPFKDGEFDVILSSGLLEHVNAVAFLKEVHRLLKPEGYNIIFNIPNKYNLNENLSYALKLVKKTTGEIEQRYSRNDIKKILTDNGFDIVSIRQEGLIPAQFGLFGKRIESFMNALAKPINALDMALNWLPFAQSFIAVCRAKSLNSSGINKDDRRFYG